MSNTVSIMMPAYNAGPYIAEAIESVLAQTYASWELIIVDDGSTDNTAEVITGFSDPRIILVQQPNLGEASARNTALRNVSGSILSFLDADDVYLPHHLESIANYLEKHPELDGVYTDGYYIDQVGKFLKPLSSRRQGPFTGDIFAKVMRSSDVFGAPVCVAVRLDLVEIHHLTFDPEIVIGPDWDFLTAYAENALFGYIDQVTCLYRVHQSNISLRTESSRRRLSLARCREKTIKRRRFDSCPLEARAFVFFDLLVNLLVGFPDRQEDIIQWKEFNNLPTSTRAQILRLMASGELLYSQQARWIQEWLKLSLTFNPKDIRTFLINMTYRVNPRLCRGLLQRIRSSQQNIYDVSPFADLVKGT